MILVVSLWLVLCPFAPADQPATVEVSTDDPLELEPVLSKEPAVDRHLVAARYRPRTRTGQWGLGFAVAGSLLVAGSSLATSAEVSAPLFYSGAFLVVLGHPAILGGALSAQQALRRGDVRVTAVPGLLGLGAYCTLWFGFLSIYPPQWDAGPKPALNAMTLSSFLGLPVLGALQLVVNGRAARGDDLHLVPTPVPGGAGVSLFLRM